MYCRVVFTINHTAESSEQTPLPFSAFSKIIVHIDKRSAKRLYLLGQLKSITLNIMIIKKLSHKSYRACAKALYNQL